MALCVMNTNPTDLLVFNSKSTRAQVRVQVLGTLAPSLSPME